VTAAPSKVYLTAELGGNYKIKGSLGSIKTSTNGGIIKMTVDGDAGGLGTCELYGQGMYNVSGRIRSLIKGTQPTNSSSGETLLTTKDCTLVTAGNNARCIEDASPATTPLNMSCMVDTCSQACNGGKMVADCSDPGNASVQATQNTTSACPSFSASIAKVASFAMAASAMLMVS